MAMDGLNLAASVAECRRIVGGRIDKIQQPEKDELAVNLRCGGENLRLLISASPEHCRMQLTNVKRKTPIERAGILYAAEEAPRRWAHSVCRAAKP